MAEQKDTNNTAPQPSSEELREISDSVEGGRFMVGGRLVNSEGEPVKAASENAASDKETETPAKKK